MGIFHFLNVKQGDCHIIQHASGRVTVIDVCNARLENTSGTLLGDSILDVLLKANYGQKNYPVNPIEYMKRLNVTEIWRFVATHPDMDHLDGIKDLFAAFPVYNFWDTKNTKELTDWGNNSPWRKEDWQFYKSLRDGTAAHRSKRFTNHAGDRNKYWNMDDVGGGGDGINILAPSPELVRSANDSGDHNDCSYAILYRSPGGRILCLGDAHDDTIDYILANFRNDVTDLELLIAPHHGRHSNRKFDFLNIMRPKLTLFGNASSEHLAYDAWYNRDLPIMTNNQASTVIVNTDGKSTDGTAEMDIYVTNEIFARAQNPYTWKSSVHDGWYVSSIKKGVAKAA